MYLPGFPGIARALHTSIDKVQLSLTSYFVGIAVGQLLYGPLLDRFGRRRPLYLGLFIYVGASVLCAFAGSVESLIAFRLLQALGGCVGMVASQALVRDVFPVQKTAQVFSLITLVIAVSPMIAPNGRRVCHCQCRMAVGIYCVSINYCLDRHRQLLLSPCGKGRQYIHIADAQGRDD
jgi:DHA1 family bicyclomycin/chloramphenicol resistance-like MFS transporter